MPVLKSPALTAKESERLQAERETEALLRPMLTEGNQIMTGDGTLENPVRSMTVEEQLTERASATTEGGVQPSYEAEYAAATTPQAKAQVAAKYGDWERAYGNSQNVIGEVRRSADEWKAKYEGAASVRPVQEPPR